MSFNKIQFNDDMNNFQSQGENNGESNSDLEKEIKKTLVDNLTQNLNSAGSVSNSIMKASTGTSALNGLSTDKVPDELDRQVSRQNSSIVTTIDQLNLMNQSIKQDQDKLRDLRISLAAKYETRDRLAHVLEAMNQFVQVLESQGAD